jgi:hypothetical protein
VVQTENLEKFPTCVDGELTGSIEEKWTHAHLK